jgi:HK97 family phage major capsid protein/HK97 family phage prohead protease
MPISPGADEDQDEWMARCVPEMMESGDRTQEQCVAICLDLWRDKDKSITTGLLPVADRAWSTLQIKSLDAERREIEGIASTPTVDRIGDIVRSEGGQFTLPLPLLRHHRHDEPVGHVTVAKATKNGITIRAKFAKIDEPGELKNRIDTAWQEVRSGLVRGLSIGFKPIEYELLEDGKGIDFKTWSLYELSLVTIPANAEANITTIKSIDLGAASGPSQGASALSRPGASGKPVSLKPKGRTTMSTETAGERIGALEAKRAANLARMNTLSEEAGKKGETLADDAADEYDGLEREIETLDKQLERERKLERFNVAQAKPVIPSETKTVADGAAARGGYVRVKAPELPKGVAFARVVRCLGLAQGNRAAAAEIAAQLYGDDQRIVDTLKAAARGGELSDVMVAKASVPAGTTSETTWAAPLVRESSVFADFAEFLRPATVLGKFGTNGVPALRQVPFRTALLSETSGGAGYWVGEGRPKPLTKFDYSKTSLVPTKVANIAVVTEELLRDSSPSAETLLRDSLAAALVAKLDTDFTSATAGEAAISPAGILNGVTAIASSGVTQAAVLADIQAVMATFVAANNIPSQGVWIMASTTAMALGLMLTSLGQAAFPTVTMAGGSLYGMPVIVSDYVPGGGGSPASKMVILVNAGDIYLADEGGITVDMSREASLEMLDNPTNAVSGAGGSPLGQPVHTTMVSLWQVNAVGFRAERTITWQKRRTSAVAAISNVVWGT